MKRKSKKLNDNISLKGVRLLAEHIKFSKIANACSEDEYDKLMKETTDKMICDLQEFASPFFIELFEELFDHLSFNKKYHPHVVIRTLETIKFSFPKMYSNIEYSENQKLNELFS